jgi:non-specific serine/threonine protein kinase
MPPQFLTLDKHAHAFGRYAANSTTATKGRRYYYDGRVDCSAYQPEEADFTVQGSEPEPYEVIIKANSRSLEASCACPFIDGYGSCKHIVASLYKLRDYLEEMPFETWETKLAKALNVDAAKKKPTAAPAMLFFSLQNHYGRWMVSLFTLPAARFPEQIRSDIVAVTAMIRDERLSSKAKRVRTFDPDRFVNVTGDSTVAARIVSAVGQAYLYSAEFANLDQVMALIEEAPVFVGSEDDPLRTPLTVVYSGARGELKIDSIPGGGFRLSPIIRWNGEEIDITAIKREFILHNPLWMLVRGNVAVRLSNLSTSFLTMVDYGILDIPADERNDFVEKYLVELSEAMPVTGDAVQWGEAQSSERPVQRLYLTEEDGGGVMQVDLRFGYGDIEFTYDPSLPEYTIRRNHAAGSLVKYIRDPIVEQSAWDSLTKFGLKKTAENGILLLRANVSPVNFLLREVPKLSQAGFEIYGEERLKQARVNRSRPTMSLRVSSGIDWFDVKANVTFGGVEANWKDIRRAIRSRDRYVKLADGAIGELPTEWVERYRHLFALAEDADDGLKLAKHQIVLLEEAVAQEDVTLSTDETFDRQRNLLRSFETISPHEAPKDFVGQLYPYQKAGFDWLHFLHEYEFGGCLADDMGLGKTMQALAFLLSLRDNANDKHAKTPDLIVAPRSVLFNWEREAAKFTPTLKVSVHADTSRDKSPTAYADADLVLTTYGVMMRDIAILKQCRFHYIVLDESQAIKNPLSQTARAARLLQADHRLTLTGTPVENGVLELWSQFAFLNPGLLGSLERFRSEFASAIERQNDDQSAQLLRRMVQPFLLRRTKSQVAPDLPPRSDQPIFNEMEPAQRRLYTKMRDQFRTELLGLLEDGSPGGQAQMKILEGLLRLRQICNHPGLVDKSYEGGSAKLTALIETLQTLQAEGHKALVFSQFTQMLSLVRKELDALAIPYVYLDGSTRDRQSRVDQFQNSPEIPFFLISLKAGGVGINLTAADYVLHIDPWWNPAVEQQATDRAHRIGQTKPVFVYRFITKDSVEEQILLLQDRKRAIVEQVISAETGFFKSLSKADIESLFS